MIIFGVIPNNYRGKQMDQKANPQWRDIPSHMQRYAQSPSYKNM